MENASKALIIAGAILISILLISLGIMIYNQAKSVTDSQQMDQVAMQQYNSQFEQYAGTNKPGSQVRALVNQVRSSNALDENSERKITFSGSAGLQGEAPTSDQINAIKTTSKYKVTINYETAQGSNNGLVKEIVVDK